MEDNLRRSGGIMCRRVYSVDSLPARKRSLAPNDKLNGLARFRCVTNIPLCALTGANRCADDTGDLSDPSTLYTAAGSCIKSHSTAICYLSVLLKQPALITSGNVHSRHWTPVLESPLPGGHRLNLSGTQHSIVMAQH